MAVLSWQDWVREDESAENLFASLLLSQSSARRNTTNTKHAGLWIEEGENGWQEERMFVCCCRHVMKARNHRPVLLHVYYFWNSDVREERAKGEKRKKIICFSRFFTTQTKNGSSLFGLINDYSLLGREAREGSPRKQFLSHWLQQLEVDAWSIFYHVLIVCCNNSATNQ